MSSVPPYPPPPDGLRVISIDTLKAALAKMEIDVSVEDVMAVMREVEEAQANERRAILSECKLPTTAARLLCFNPSIMLVVLQTPKQYSGLQSTTTSDFVQHPPRPEMVVPLPIERRRRLIELYGQAFPDGRVSK